MRLLRGPSQTRVDDFTQQSCLGFCDAQKGAPSELRHRVRARRQEFEQAVLIVVGDESLCDNSATGDKAQLSGGKGALSYGGRLRGLRRYVKLCSGIIWRKYSALLLRCLPF